MTPEIDAKLRKSFAAQSMMQTLGARLERIEPGLVEVRAPILPGARQQHGAGHAGLSFSIGDSAAGYAALSMMALEAEVVTAEIKINLLAMAQGDSLLARGRVIKPGRRLIVVSAEIFAYQDSREVLIAVMQGTMVPV